MTKNPRYQNKAFLRFLECYTLWAIGELSKEDESNMEKITPHLQSMFKMQGDWKQIVAAVMELPHNMPELIRGCWEKNLEIARQNSAILAPQEFAEMFVDSNLR